MKVNVVLKNADFTECRGPMLFHKVFVDLDKAVEYVKGQSGIFGGQQYDKPSSFSSKNRLSFNGFDILTDIELE
jgi:hypothetical protein